MAKGTITIMSLALLACAGCRPRQEALSEKEAALAAATGIPAELLLEVKHAGKNLRQLQGTDPNGNPLSAAGVTIDVNYDISPEMVIARLKKWDAEFGLVLSGVSFDWMEAQFKRRPGNMLEFAKEVYAFCPDVVDQGTETVEALAKEMKRTNTLFLWWD